MRTQESFSVVPGSPVSVLVEVLVEIQYDFRKKVHNSSSKSYLDLKSANTLSVFSSFGDVR